MMFSTPLLFIFLYILKRKKIRIRTIIVDMWIKRGYLFYALRIHLSKVFIHLLFDIFNLILNEIVAFSTNF